MDLILDDSYQSFYLELLTNFTKLAKSKYVNNLKLSSALKLSPESGFKLAAAPLLADANGKGYNSHLSITYYLAELFMVKEALIGKNQAEELQVFFLAISKWINLTSMLRLYQYLNSLRERDHKTSLK